MMARRILFCLFAWLAFQASAFSQTHLTPAPEGAFSIVVIPDTQAYRAADRSSPPDAEGPLTNPVFEAHVDWIVNNLGKQRIVFVSHVGDIVDKNVRNQWQVARACMDKLHGRVPYGISVGNHDMTRAGDSSLFQEFFPKSRFESFDWYGGCFEPAANPEVSGNNANSYQLFSAGEIDFLFLHLECNAPDPVLAWAEEILKKYSDRPAFITTHMGWGPRNRPKVVEEFVTGEKGRMTWKKIHGERGNTPQQLWDKFYRRQPNLVAVFSGDQSRSHALRAVTRADDGHPIHEFMQDYSTGWLRIYRFLPAENRVEAYTFHPQTEELCTGTKFVPDRGQHQFSFTFDMSARSRATTTPAGAPAKSR